ncbi:MAG: glycosyltransferase [Euryarchaeota archaeon]|nr:glycosyltransferase [Euryarchaeota archaeon]
METFIMHPEISVIVPTPNEEEYLKRTLAPIANQNTNTPCELIVADSESTGESRSITDKVLNPTLPRYNTCVMKDAYFKIGGYRNVPLEDIEFSRRISRIEKTGYFDDVIAITSPRRLDRMGFLGTLYYYAQLDLGRVIDGSMIDKMSKKLGILNLRDYVGLQ